MIFCISLQNIYFVQISGWRALVCIFVKVKLVFYLSFHQCNVGTKHCIAFLVVLELSPNYQRPCVHNVYYTLPFNSRKTLTIYLFCRERCLRQHFCLKPKEDRKLQFHRWIHLQMDILQTYSILQTYILQTETISNHLFQLHKGAWH